MIDLPNSSCRGRLLGCSHSQSSAFRSFVRLGASQYERLAPGKGVEGLVQGLFEACYAFRRDSNLIACALMLLTCPLKALAAEFLGALYVPLLAAEQRERQPAHLAGRAGQLWNLRGARLLAPAVSPCLSDRTGLSNSAEPQIVAEGLLGVRFGVDGHLWQGRSHRSTPWLAHTRFHSMTSLWRVGH